MKFSPIILFILLMSPAIGFSQERVGDTSSKSIDPEFSRVAQVENNDGAIEDLIRNFFVSGSCLEIKEISASSAAQGGSLAQIGKFQKSANLDIGFEEGIVLSSGNVNSVVGPNTSGNTTGFFQDANIPDQAVLQFKFKPTGDEISFNYVFGSEEYADNAGDLGFVCQFNDSFSFLLRREGTTTWENIALIPNTTLPVTINNINDLWGNTDPALNCLVGDYSSYYISNFPNENNSNDPDIQELEFDGYTVPLVASKSGLVACEWYEMRIVIEDLGDGQYDSAVFLEANSFADNSPIDIGSEGTISGTQDAEESCKNGYFEISRAGDTPLDVDFTVELNVTGSATPGVDYEPLPTTVVIPSGEAFVRIPVVPYYDDDVEGTENITIEATNITCGCADVSISAEITIVDFTLDPTVTIDTFCEGGSYDLPDGTTVDESGTYQVLVPRGSDSDCDELLVYELTEVPPPSVINTSLEACSETNEGVFNLPDADEKVSAETGLTVTYYPTMAQAEAGTGALADSYTTANDVVFARVVNGAGCWSVAEVELRVMPIPENITIQAEQVCDSDEDGQSTFDLTSKISEALGSQSSSDFSVSFHLNDAAAQTGDDKIDELTNFTVTSNPQTVYIRVENQANTTCYRVLPFEFSFYDNPAANDVPISIPTCSVSPTTTFNLNDIALQVADGNNSMQVEFFKDAEATMPITNPTAYESGSTVVYGRVTNPTTGCYAFGQVQLEVLGEPVRRDQAMPLCATNSDNNSAQFNLRDFDNDIIGNTQGVTVTYHTSFDDANANVSGGLNPIADPSVFPTNTVTVYARSEAVYETSFCYTVSEVALTVNTRPTANPATYQICVESGSETDFNLQSKVSEIAPDSGVSVTFYTDEAAQNQITTPSAYTSGTNRVYAKVVNNATGCEELTSLDLEVVEIPELNDEIELVLCKTNGIAAFDLAQLKTDLETEYPTLTFSFFADEALTNALPTSYPLEESATAYVRYDLNGTPCFNSESFTFTVTATPNEDRGEEFICISDGFTLPDGTVVFEAGVYEVIIQNDQGCDVLTKTTLIVSDIEFPNAFAPNGNGKNETFGALPNNACIGQVSDYYFVIYNNWGEKVFETTDFLTHWNGQFNGETQTGTYFWQAKYTFQDVAYDRSGTVTLLF